MPKETKPERPKPLTETKPERPKPLTDAEIKEGMERSRQAFELIRKIEDEEDGR